MRWWLTAALVLQMVGLVLAVSGIASTKRELFHGRPLPHRRAWSWTRRRVLRQRGTSQTIVGTTATMTMGATASAFAQTLPARPDQGATAGEWAVYLERKVDNLADLRDHDHNEWKARTDRLGSLLDTERAERSADVTRLERRLGTVVGGEDGRGLDMAWWGLTLTLVGTFIGGIAGMVAVW